MASLAGAFSGLLAFAIEKMNGIGNRSGWQWYHTFGIEYMSFNAN